ncbi:nitroreductase [Acutalibacter sp. 1XD8-33]|uniref:nitroreductase family protein n=1 Tax=Acutalibacter sp. 1XD8-33 TaxID=2320081 RepID=UPI000EA2CE64|nr:nitroreductase family protein [Acutalibacter sp. 1XD8-33]RKJ39928.1 nitroreductase [Acutalibacter sp. 1XD8-33]
MNFYQLAESRFSVRKFSGRPVEREKLDLILRAGQVAPTACNLQPQRVLVIQSPEALEKYLKCTLSHFHAPLALLVCYDRTQCWTRSYDGKTSGEVDAAIVSTHMMLEAASLGVGSTWVMHFIPEAVREEFQLPEAWEPVNLLAMGYPAEGAEPSPLHGQKKALEETVRYL